jgi:hypothetical protein
MSGHGVGTVPGDPMEPHGTRTPTADPMARHRTAPIPCTTPLERDPMHRWCSAQRVKG